MKSFFVCGLLFCFIGLITFVAGQDRKHEEKGSVQKTDTKPNSDQIEIKTDRFSNITTVVLKPQVILDRADHQIAIGIETKLGEKKLSDWEMEEILASVSIESQSKEPIDLGDEELHFIIDGNPMNLGETRRIDIPYADRREALKPSFKISHTFVAYFHRRHLEQISKAKRIEMRFGTLEMMLSQPIVVNLREYSNQVLAQHKISKEKKP